jgi:hypothetical protein
MVKLTDYDQFILVKLIPSANGKSDKIPVNAKGEAINPHLPDNWMARKDAETQAALLGFKVGFVLTDNDPFFCLDMDSCLLPDKSGWSPLSTEIVQMFAGCMVEVSQSLSGLHVWGTAAAMPSHACKNVKLGIELYHNKRFILLGVQPQGDEGLDCSAILPTAIDKWFPSTSPTTGIAEWTTVAVEGYAGLESDEELLVKMLASTSAKSVFGTSISFRHLWEADVQALGEVWPSEGREFDASSADAALAQRLAFWTGNNCERIKKFMLESGLRRDKYERDDYLRRTILNAVSRQAQVYSKPTQGKVEHTKGRRGWIAQSEVPAFFEGYIYIREQDAVYTPEGKIWQPVTFKNCLGGCKFKLDEQKTSRNAWEAFHNTEYYEPQTVDGTCFRPELKPGSVVEQEGRSVVNTYMPIAVDAVEGDTTKFTRHVKKLYPNGNDYELIMSYLAAMVQYPGRKFQWAPVLQGGEGNGKTLIVTAASRAVGEVFSHTLDAQDLGGNGGKFNSWIANKLLISVEEIYTKDKREVLEILKPLVTNHRIQIQGKGKDQYTGDNRANFIFTSNYVDAIQLNENTRRYAVFLSAQQNKDDLRRDGMDGDYFVDLYDWFNGDEAYSGQTAGWKHIAHLLKTYPIKNEMNPAKLLQRAPVTSTTAIAIDASRGRVEQEVQEAVEQGLPGFAGGWVSSTMLNQLLERKKLTSRLPLNRYPTMLKELGYVPHPGLTGGRTGSVVTPDGARSRLYVKEDSIQYNMTDGDKICQAYMKAQAVATTEAARFQQGF